MEIFKKEKRLSQRVGAPESAVALCVQSGEFLGKLRLLVVGVVLVKNPFRFSRIDRRDRLGIQGVRRFFIARVHGVQELLDARFQSGFDRFVLAGFLFGNQYAFFC